MIKVAVIGTGVMGNYHARNYTELEGVELIAVCDTNEQNGRKVAALYNTKFYHNHLDLLKNEPVNAVSITTPTIFHDEIAKDFIKKKVHVLVEKPLAATSAQAKNLVQLAEEENVILLTGHIERYNPVVIKLEELSKEGEFGEILSIAVKRVGIAPPKSLEANVITDLAVHDLDIITHLLNRLPTSIYAKGSDSTGHGVYDHAEIFLDYDNFASFIQANWVTPIKIRNMTITGSKKYAELNFLTQKLTLYENNNEIMLPQQFTSFINTTSTPKIENIPIDFQEPLKNEIQNFLNAINNNEKLRVTGEEAVSAIFLAENIINSIASDKVIKLTQT